MQVKSALNGKTINLTGDNTIIKSTNFNVDKNGNMTCKNANVTGTITSSNATITGGKVTLKGSGSVVGVWGNGSAYSQMDPAGIALFYNGSNYVQMGAESGQAYIDLISGYSSTNISNSGITTPTLTQTSLAEHKKNFEKMQDNALEIIKNIDIYKYNLKNEKDTDKKHIGFVIGDNYNYSKEVTSIDNQGVDNYSFTSLCCKAIQEQQEQIEQLQEKDKQNEEIIANLIERIDALEKEVNNANS